MCINKKYIISLSLIFIFFIFINLVFIINHIFFREINVKSKEGHYEECVYITPDGSCYHSQYCSYINEKKQIGLNQAITSGYKKCDHCNGISNSYIWINGYIFLLEQNNYFASFMISSCICLTSVYILNKSIFIKPLDK